MIHPNEPQEAPEWTVQPATCRRCSEAWHPDCAPLELPTGVELGDN